MHDLKDIELALRKCCEDENLPRRERRRVLRALAFPGQRYELLESLEAEESVHDPSGALDLQKLIERLRALWKAIQDLLDLFRST